MVQLNNDLFNDPLAMFPGPDGFERRCLSWPDTFDGAFTVDFPNTVLTACLSHKCLRLDGQEAVNFSNFKVRACTPKEVDFVRHYIETVDLKTFANCTKWGNSAATEEQRADTLRFLTWATSPNNSRDPILKNAKPLILPEEVEDADTQELETTRRDAAIAQFRKFVSGKTVFELSNTYKPSEWQKEATVTELDVAASSPNSFPVTPPFVGKSVFVLSSEFPSEDPTNVFLKLSSKVDAPTFREMFFRADPRGKNIVIEEVGVDGN